MGSGRAKRRRRQRKLEKRQSRPRKPRDLVLSGASAFVSALPRLRKRRRPESPGDKLAVEGWLDDPPGGAPVREPRRPGPSGPLAGAAALELPPEDEDLDAVSVQPR